MSDVFYYTNIDLSIINAIVEVAADNRTLFPLRCCQSHFGKTSIPVV